jgi:hypothetical protein
MTIHKWEEDKIQEEEGELKKELKWSAFLGMREIAPSSFLMGTN